MDLAEMRVQTFTGDLSASIDAANGNISDWDELLKNAKSSGTVRLALDTSMKIDGDTTLFIGDGVAADVKESHTNAVEGARAYRKGMIDAFADLLGIRQ
ncbi:MAG: hypothetical protein AAFY88_08640 [Acidobacteriota bacterium]